MKRTFMVFLYKIAFQLAQIYYAVFRPITLGVKVMLVRGNEVMLVRHSYQPGWFLPGGGVKRNETLVEAIHREANEELGATLHNLEMITIFSNNQEGKSDHIVEIMHIDCSIYGTYSFILTYLSNSNNNIQYTILFN